MLFVLPTAELFNEPEETKRLLQKIDLPLEVLGETIVSQWAQIEGEWGGQFNPFDMSTFELIMSAIVGDFLHDSALLKLDPSERGDVIKAIKSFCREFYTNIIGMLEDMTLTQYQLQTLRIHKWLGHSMVIDIVF